MAGEQLHFGGDLSVRDQIQARSEHAATAHKTFLIEHNRRWTYRQFRDESVRMGHFLLGRLEEIDDRRPGHVAMMLENRLELMALFGGCAVSGLTLFGINTGLRGETLTGVLNQSQARVLVVEETMLPALDMIRDQLDWISEENLLVVPSEAETSGPASLSRALDQEVGTSGPALEMPDVGVTPETNLMVIYTSGTTGLPKGINNNQFKMCATGLGVSMQAGLGPDDVAYVSMPMFHSNSMFIGVMPAFWSGGQVGMHARFSASGFVADILEYGATYWNYVGEPVHYVLAHLQETYGDDIDRLRAEVTINPDNHLRLAIGNGASAPDIDRLTNWFGLNDVHELYGSTEAAISTFRKSGDPRGSVGEVVDPAVQILDASGDQMPPALLDESGGITNYEESVGEICRVGADAGLFQGYFDNDDATDDKYHDHVYHSGDLGHIVERESQRFLFFDGRTDDWIRKDGENFSALQVARFAAEFPGVALAAAYGVPCAVSDELVMVALSMRDDSTFDPDAFFKFCEQQVTSGGMDRKWFPDFVRVVDSFEFTGTQKILVRNLKSANFNAHKIPDPLYWRERGDSSFRPFLVADFVELREEFTSAERLGLLDH
jgi:fatty-acyl-CoA synthase